ncbi:MAG: DUF4232 domain-containing protein [Actinophytocola sp.]|nr:DUF4232 domain-containing protein [Actinophytocola sp.]
MIRVSGEPPECRLEDLSVALRWERSGGGLHGQVVADNVSDHACRLSGKPVVTPLGQDHEPLGAQMIVTLEAHIPGYVTLLPGQRATAPVGWSTWCGPPASRQARISWHRGSTVVEVEGPAQPRCSDGPDNLSSSWFKLVE